MQETHYSGEAMFRIVEAVEQGGTQWTKDLYQSWRRVLANVGIGRPGYIRFLAQTFPKKSAFSGKQKLKKVLKK